MRLRAIRWKANRMSSVRLLAAQALAAHLLNQDGGFIVARGDRWEVRWLSDHDEVAA